MTIIHKKIPTAYFDIKNRILACPIFKDDLSSSLYDLFMGHEVGHLSHSIGRTTLNAKENRTLKGYLNIVEDVRLKEKSEKYAGLRKSFILHTMNLWKWISSNSKEETYKNFHLLTKSTSSQNVVQESISAN